MRDYQGIAVNQEEDPTRRDSFAKIDYFLHDLSKGFGRIQKGEVPDGSGNPIGDQKLSDIYLVLLGRDGNQVAHGGRFPGGFLTLASTTNATKGMVYFGNAQQTVYDETNERFGVATAAPTAKVHIEVGAPSFTNSMRTTADVAGGSWEVGGTGSTLFGSLSDSSSASYIKAVEGHGFGTYIGGLSSASATSVSGWVLNFSAKKTGGGDASISVTLDSGGFSWLSTATPSLGTSFVDYTFPVSPLSATAANLAVSRVGFSGNTIPGFGEIEIAEMHLDIPIPGVAADSLQRWGAGSTSARLDFGDSGASTVDLQLSGNAPLYSRLGDGTSGLRFYTSASTAFIEAGTTGQSAENLVIGGNRQSQASTVFISAASATAGNIFRAAQVGIGAAPTLSPAIHLDVTGRTRWPWVQYAVTGSSTNHDVGASTFVLASASATGQQVRGITNGVDGRMLFLANNGSQELKLVHEAAGGTAANKLKISTGLDVTLTVNDAVVLVYDGSISRWRMTKWCSPVGQELIEATWTFEQPVHFNQVDPASGFIIIDADSSVAGPHITFRDEGIGATATLGFATFSAGTYVLTLPQASDTIVARNTTDTLQNKTLNATNCSALVTDQTQGFSFADSNTTTKKLRFTTASAVGSNAIAISGTGARLWTLGQDFDSRIMVAGVSAVGASANVASGTLGYIDVTGISASIGTTRLGNTVPAGRYRVSWYMRITTAGDAAPTDQIVVTVGWDDGGGVRSADQVGFSNAGQAVAPPLPVSTLNRVYSGSWFMNVGASTNITVLTTLTNAGATNPVYNFMAALESL